MTAAVVIALLFALTLWQDRPLKISTVAVDAEGLLTGEREPLEPALGPLPSDASVVEASIEANNLALARPTGTLSVSLSAATGDILAAEIAVLDGRSGARLAHHKLEPTVSSLGFTGLPVGSHWLVTYNPSASARYAYTQRIGVEIREGAVALQSLSLQTHSLFVSLIETEPGKGPTGMVVAVLERSDDPSWRQSRAILARPDPRGIQLLIQGLAPGDYLLSIPGFELEDAEKFSVQIQGRTGLELRGSWREPL